MPPVCVKCCKEMTPAKNGVWWVKMRKSKKEVLMPNLPPNGHWLTVYDNQPYKITMCDRWQCPGCGQEILTGFSNYSTEHWQNSFASVLESAVEHDEVYYEEV